MNERRLTGDKIIITVAPTSNFQGKEANPALPYSSEEVAQNALLMHHIDLLPPDSLFSVLGRIGRVELEMAVQSMLLGGNCRIGFEDNVTYSRGRLAKNNAELVAKAVRVARELGREPATPAEVRQTLGIPPLKMNKNK